jgi:general secretion pathway protein D
MKYLFPLWLVFASFAWCSTCANKTFSLDAFSAQSSSLRLIDIVRDLSQQCQISVIFEDDRARNRLDRPVDLISLQDVSLEGLFDFLFEAHNLFYTYDWRRNLVRVGYYETANIDVDYINMSELKTESVKSITVGAKAGDNNDDTFSVGQGSNADFTTVTATSLFTFWAKLKEHLEEILKTDEDYDPAINKILVDQDAAIVTITASQRQMQKVRQYLKRLEKNMHAQVMIEAYLIELTYSDEKSMGIDWSQMDLNLLPKASYLANSDGLSSNFFSFSANFTPEGVMRFLNTYGDVEVLSNPKVLTLNNQPAVINVGKQLSYLYQTGNIGYADSGNINSSTTYELGSVFVGLTLNIIPEITEDNHIIMRVNPVSSELLNEESMNSEDSSGRTMPPDTRIKQMSSIVKVKDGQQILLGGLVEKRSQADNSKVPLLGDVPLLGRLFSHEGTKVSKNELFILIVPTLIKGDSFPSLDEAIIKRLN